MALRRTDLESNIIECTLACEDKILKSFSQIWRDMASHSDHYGAHPSPDPVRGVSNCLLLACFPRQQSSDGLRHVPSSLLSGEYQEWKTSGNWSVGFRGGWTDGGACVNPAA